MPVHLFRIAVPCIRVSISRGVVQVRPRIRLGSDLLTAHSATYKKVGFLGNGVARDQQS